MTQIREFTYYGDTCTTHVLNTNVNGADVSRMHLVTVRRNAQTRKGTRCTLQSPSFMDKDPDTVRLQPQEISLDDGEMDQLCELWQGSHDDDSTVATLLDVISDVIQQLRMGVVASDVISTLQNAYHTAVPDSREEADF